MTEFSIILPTYMLGKYIRPNLQSLLEQTFKDFELIIVDDGSSDNTEHEVAKVKDSRINYIRQRHTGHPGRVRNSALAAARGRLIAFFDGDDIWHPNKLKRCLEIFNKDYTIDILCHDLNFQRMNDQKVFRRSLFGPYPDDMYRYLLLKGNALAISATVVKRSVFSDDKYLFSEDRKFITAEDYELWLRLAKSKRYRFLHIPEVLGVHRVFEDSISMRNIKQTAANMLYLLEQNIRQLGADGTELRTVEKKRKSQILLGAALAFNYRRQFSESLTWDYQAIKEYPLYLKPYFTFLASLLRIKIGYL